MLSVVIPCFDEEGAVGRYAAELFPALEPLRPYEVVAVDDGSTDGTAAALAALAARFPLRLERHAANRGLGAALRTGFSVCSGDWIATLDADLTFAPSSVAALIARQKETGADFVAGSPFLAGGAADVPWRRRLPSALVNAFYRGFISPKLTAYTPILRLYRASALRSVTLSSAGFEVNAEIAARLLRAGFKAAEAPAELTVRREGVSKLSARRELLRHARLVLRLLSGR